MMTTKIPATERLDGGTFSLSGHRYPLVLRIYNIRQGSREREYLLAVAVYRSMPNFHV